MYDARLLTDGLRRMKRVRMKEAARMTLHANSIARGAKKYEMPPRINWPNTSDLSFPLASYISHFTSIESTHPNDEKKPNVPNSLPPSAAPVGLSARPRLMKAAIMPPPKVRPIETTTN